ncbi:MAG: GTPase [Bacteroidota bacterium]
MVEKINRTLGKEKKKKAVAVIGESGNGRSTLINAFMKNIEKKVTKEKDSDGTVYDVEKFDVKEENKGPEIVHGLDSGTTHPSCHKFEEEDMFFLDLPGFSDTRSIEYKLHTSYAHKKAIKGGVKALVIVLTVPTRGSTIHIPDLWEVFPNIIKDPIEHKDSIFFVFSKGGKKTNTSLVRTMFQLCRKAFKYQKDKKDIKNFYEAISNEIKKKEGFLEKHFVAFDLQCDDDYQKKLNTLLKNIKNSTGTVEFSEDVFIGSISDRKNIEKYALIVVQGLKLLNTLSKIEEWKKKWGGKCENRLKYITKTIDEKRKRFLDLEKNQKKLSKPTIELIKELPEKTKQRLDNNPTLIFIFNSQKEKKQKQNADWIKGIKDRIQQLEKEHNEINCFTKKIEETITEIVEKIASEKDSFEFILNSFEACGLKYQEIFKFKDAYDAYKKRYNPSKFFVVAKSARIW